MLGRTLLLIVLLFSFSPTLSHSTVKYYLPSTIDEGNPVGDLEVKVRGYLEYFKTPDALRHEVFSSILQGNWERFVVAREALYRSFPRERAEEETDRIVKELDLAVAVENRKASFERVRTVVAFDDADWFEGAFRQLAAITPHAQAEEYRMELLRIAVSSGSPQITKRILSGIDRRSVDDNLKESLFSEAANLKSSKLLQLNRNPLSNSQSSTYKQELDKANEVMRLLMRKFSSKKP